ncbi:MAG TPA: hypothetical protein VF613_09105 [Longimicrobium sp.]|jgi:hypothetical protein
MTNILSLISGSFSRALLLGTLFPLTLFALLALLFVVPFLPADIPHLAPLAQLDPAWKTVLFTVAVILGTGLLYSVNVPLVRLYQGYPWRFSWLGQWAVAREQRRREWADSRRTRLRDLVDEIREENPNHPVLARLEPWRTRVALRATNEYPGPEEVLPTRLGNAIRSSEEYPRAVYGISTLSLWPRLGAVMSKEALALLDESKAAFDFMINACFLSGLLSGSIFVAGLLVPARIQWTEWLIQVAVAGMASRVFYVGSVRTAVAWGDQVKSAFDLFRWDLLKKLGYLGTPDNPEEERKLWEQISRRIIYGNPPASRPPLSPYKLDEPALIISSNGDS